MMQSIKSVCSMLLIDKGRARTIKHIVTESINDADTNTVLHFDLSPSELNPGSGFTAFISSIHSVQSN
jgi:hypothetical protein